MRKTGLKDLGTPEHAGIKDSDVRSALLSKDTIESVERLTPVDSGVNVTYRATVRIDGDEREVFVKLASFIDNSRFRGEPETIKRLADTDVPSPEFVCKGEGDHLSVPWYAMTHEPGEQATDALTERDSEDVTDILHDTGRVLGAIHANVEVEFAGERVSNGKDEVKTFEDGDWPAAFYERAESVAEQADPRFGQVQELIMEEIDEAEVANPDQYSLLHLDYWWENILVAPSEPRVSSVVDWGRAVGGDPLCGFAVGEYLCVDNHDWSELNIDRTEARRAFREGYAEEHVPRSDSDDWRIYQLFARLYALRGFPYWWRDVTEQEREDAEDELREAVLHLIAGDTHAPAP